MGFWPPQNGSVLTCVTDDGNEGDEEDAEENKKKAGDVLLSHTVTHAVPSTQKSLTSEFGMESGVASSLLSPARLKKRFLIVSSRSE